MPIKILLISEQLVDNYSFSDGIELGNRFNVFLASKVRDLSFLLVNLLLKR